MILIIDKSKSNAKKYADTMYYLGVPTLAVTPTEALSKVSKDFKAIILLNTHLFADLYDYVNRLRSYSADVPIFAVCKDKNDFNYTRSFDAVYENTYITSVFNNVCNYCTEHNLCPPSRFRLAGLDATVSIDTPIYLWHPIDFSRTERMLLRVFIATYPRVISPKELLVLAFKKARLSQPSNIRAHVSIMNKKFREATGRNLITLSECGKGYHLITPENATLKEPALAL